MVSSDSVRFDFVVPALKQLLAQFPGRLRLVAIGPPGDFLHTQGLAVEQLAVMDYVGFRRYIASQTDAVGIIPLDDTPFGACKSAIKFMDYALAGIPSVCSAVAPYSDVVRQGENGLLADNTSDSWFDAIARLCTSVELRSKLATQARIDVQTDWSLARAADSWQAIVDAQLGDKRPTVTIDFNLPRRPRMPRLMHFWRRLQALRWAIDMEGGLWLFLRRVVHLWRIEGPSGLQRRLAAFRSRGL
jgi:glycosyltransferase involved in cell wall biosynthesis